MASNGKRFMNRQTRRSRAHSSSPRRIAARLLPAACALVALGTAATANAQSSCYKGSCDGLDVRATGSNFGAMTVRSNGPWPVTSEGVSGGEIDVDYVGGTASGACVGFATALPDHILTVENESDLRIEVESNRDTALLIHGPDGWRCNDDGNGYQPLIEGDFERGTYRIWVSSYGGGYHDYELFVSDALWGRVDTGGGQWGGGHGGGGRPGHGRPGRQPEIPDATATAAVNGSATIGRRTGIVQLEGFAGGSVDASDLDTDEACVGFTQRNPNHIITLTERFDNLEVFAAGDIDTTLVIHGPHGWRCNDDFDGYHPGINGSFPPGTYRVWVGAYRARDTGNYVLNIADMDNLRPPPQQEPHTYTFVGRFEDLDVRFSSDTVHGVFQECRAFTATSDSLDWVDDIEVHGRSYRNGPSYWEADALCAIAALNAESSRGRQPVVSGVIEDMVPFAIYARPDEARDLLDVYIPRVADSGWIDDVTVNGQASHNGPGYWSADEVIAIIAAGITDRRANFFASGTIEDTAFSFSGRDESGIQQACLEFIAGAMAGEWIDDVTVNGTQRHNASGWWSPADVCMIVSAHAEEQRGGGRR